MKGRHKRGKKKLVRHAVLERVESCNKSSLLQPYHILQMAGRTIPNCNLSLVWETPNFIVIMVVGSPCVCVKDRT